ncbi:class I SAM-dependent methyltransferase [Pelobacter seleniigenes]|uniref:class I SAM-dependent methyltransferase n=1 Tax=Pelobacter seleniigenes TaxID=407188 RepID=UPI0004A6B598|nr:class I SAM-dependent methyltransferase [Pelobacter seleniigenes]
MLMDAQTYDDEAINVNAPVYAYYAVRILEKTGIYRGVCLDVGCGGGYLGLALAPISELSFIFLDQSADMLGCAEKNIARFALRDRAQIVQAPVQNIPLADSSVELIVSRGSVPFWDKLETAFAELHRVLKPGGRAYIGGGMGPPGLWDSLQQKARHFEPRRGYRKPAIPRRERGVYEQALGTAGIRGFSVSHSDDGTWIEFGKAVGSAGHNR